MSENAAISPQQVEIGVHVVRSGNRVEDEIEAIAFGGHGGGVGGEHNAIGAQALGIGDFIF